MNINRRRFIKLNSLLVAGSPFIMSCSSRLKSRLSNDLYTLFRNPPNSSKVFVRWWWNGNKVTIDEIVRELGILDNAGIGGVEINPIQFPPNAVDKKYNGLEWLNDEWLEILKKTLYEAKKRGVICDLIVGSGWPFGGEFLKKEEQTQILTVGSRRTNGPNRLLVPIEEIYEETAPRHNSRNKNSISEIIGFIVTPTKLEAFQDYNKPNILDGKLVIDVPAGTHIIHYLVKHTGFQAVINGAPGAKGPVLNHYNEKAVKNYLTRMSDRIIEKIETPSDYIRAMFTDSIELDGANWCDDMENQFEMRRGYSISPYLPYIIEKTGVMGNPLENDKLLEIPEQIKNKLNHVRYDFEITRIELFRERFINVFHEWCNSLGVKSRMQAYGRGYHPIDSNTIVDIPECETWMSSKIGESFPEWTIWTGRGYTISNKFTSSGAHLSGKKIISCEEITNTSMVFNASLERIKIAGDQSNLSGVTHSVLHGFNYSPPATDFPGWIRYGTFFNERNPWWPYFKYWAEYKARLSTVLQNTEMKANIALYHPLPDLWMKHGMQRDPFPKKKIPPYAFNMWEAIHQNGDACDYISDSFLQNSVTKNKKLICGKGEYQVLIIMEADSVKKETALAIKNFSENGGLILFIDRMPKQAPALLENQEDSGIINDIMSGILNKKPDCIVKAPTKNVDLISWYHNIQTNFQIKPLVEIDKPNKFVSQVSLKYNDDDALFIVNYHSQSSYELKLNVPGQDGKVPWLWDLHSGKKYLYPHSSSNPGEITLNLPPANSRLIFFSKYSEGETYKEKQPNFSEKEPLETKWELLFESISGKRFQKKYECLTDIAKDGEIKTFGGTIIYKTTFNGANRKKYNFIDLGNINGVSELWINDNYLGNNWYGPHIYFIKNHLSDGNNEIKIKVVTLLGNHVKSLKNNKVAQQWTNKQPFYPIGINGPIYLIK